MRTRVYSNPVREFATLANAMNRAFNAEMGNYDFARNGGHSGSQNSSQNSSQNGNTNGQSTKMRLPVDVWTQDEAFIITAYVPGVDPEAVEITMEGEDLSIRGTFPALPEVKAVETEGEESEAAEVKGPEFLKRELFRGAFERRLTINVPINVDNIEATYEYGLLTLRLPKAEAVRPKQIKVVAK